MARIKYEEVLKLYEHDAKGTTSWLRESFEQKKLKATDFDELGRFFAVCYGDSIYRQCRAGELMANDVFARSLTEAQGAVTTAAFQNISGQIIYSEVLEKYQLDDFVFQKLIPERPTQFLEGEKIAGVTNIGDESGHREESMPYALAGVGEDWIQTPAIRDFGFIVAVTWEALFADRTGQLLEQAGDVGKWRGQLREKQAIDCCIDENTTRHRYNWRNLGAIASYGENSGSHSWDNLTATNALVDWTDIDNAEQTFNALTDPFTGEPIPIEPKHLTVTKQNEQTARRIVSASEIRVATPGYATSGNPTLTNMANPYLNKYTVVTSRLLAARLNTDTDWWVSDWSKYARYMVAEKLNVVQAPSNSEKEFNNRIVMQFRVNERGEYVVVQPRASVKNTVS